MMKVLLINIDSKIPNIALKKLEKFYLDSGCEVICDTEDRPLLYNDIDKIFVSCIFTANKDKCREWEGRAMIGGSGYHLGVTLPYLIEEMKPKINIGFTTRGCIRKCPFCIVPQKEGKIRVVGEILDFWDRKSKDITLLDNNIMALPEHFGMICYQIAQYKLRVDFNQELDIRLLDENNVRLLKMISHKEYRFSYDQMKDEKMVRRGIEMLKNVGIKQSIFYVLTGFNTSYQEDLYRLNVLRGLNQDVFIQRYNYSKDKILTIFARWGNNHGWFRKLTLKEFVMRPENKKGYYNICKEAGLI